jgi:8-amino-7-oxononanoate synthase
MKRDDQLIQQWLKERKAQSLYRSVKVVSSPQQPRMIIDNKEVISFCSNDYLGLANHPQVKNAFIEAVHRYGVGSGAAHLVNGHTQEHDLLEKELAAFTGRDAALLFSTGYMANLGAVTALMDRGDSIFEDRLNHASLIDAGLLSRAKLIRYPHKNTARLQQKLADNKFENKMLLTDSVFSMDGDQADIPELIKLSQQHNAWLMVDDAHGFGVLGESGAGAIEEISASQNDVPLLMATLGKAVGTSGAFIAASYDHIEYLKQSARTWIYTTAMPAAIAAASRESLRLIQSEPWRREKLMDLIGLFKQGAKERGINLFASNSAIQPVIVGGSDKALTLSNQLLERGILVTAIRPPTVPDNTARLRITISASHKIEDVNQLLESLDECLG